MLLCYLEEVLAGDDESQLGTEVFCLGLAPSHPLDQLRDVISHCLQEAGKLKLSSSSMVNYQNRVENDPSDKCLLDVISLLGDACPGPWIYIAPLASPVLTNTES